MKPITLIIAVLCCPVFAFCQDITGLWKGTMYNDSTKQVLEYEIVIRKEKGKFTGYSHSSYLIGTSKYYGVKKINVRVAKDGKIVMQDTKWLESNYPGEHSAPGRSPRPRPVPHRGWLWPRSPTVRSERTHPRLPRHRSARN